MKVYDISAYHTKKKRFFPRIYFADIPANANLRNAHQRGKKNIFFSFTKYIHSPWIIPYKIDFCVTRTYTDTLTLQHMIFHYYQHHNHHPSFLFFLFRVFIVTVVCTRQQHYELMSICIRE